jgi:hypothetical protein
MGVGALVAHELLLANSIFGLELCECKLRMTLVFEFANAVSFAVNKGGTTFCRFLRCHMREQMHDVLVRFVALNEEAEAICAIQYAGVFNGRLIGIVGDPCNDQGRAIYTNAE